MVDRAGLGAGAAVAPAVQPLAIRDAYRHLARRRGTLTAAIALAAAVCFVLDLAVGPAAIPIHDVLRILLFGEPLAPDREVILREVRLPYATMAILVGAALGLAGAEMQLVLRNPLASPFTLGVTSAAAVGAALTIVLDLAPAAWSRVWTVPLGAFVCALVPIAAIRALAHFKGAAIETVVLFGIALVFAFNALLALLQMIADSDTLQQIVFWTLGSLAKATLDKAAVLAVVLCIVFALAMHRSSTVTLLLAGDDAARAAGIAVERVRMAALVRASLVAAVAVAFVGTIGFIGLVGPHVARILVGEDPRFLLPASAFSGAFLLSAASIASKTLLPGALVPVGVVTAIVGVPLFIALVLTRSRER